MNTKFKRLLQTYPQSKCASWALLFVRLVVGLAFVMHGWGKIQNPMAWMPAEAGVPGALQLLAAISEFGGGIALILGLLVPIAMLGLGFTMAVAVLMHAVVMKDPFVNMTGGSSYELALVYLSLAVMFFMVGPGPLSADQKIFGTKS